MKPNLTHLDYAEEAEAAERGNAWPQAAALWRHAAETCPANDAALLGRYRDSVVRCERKAIEPDRCPYCRAACVSDAKAINGLRPAEGTTGCEFCDPAEGGA